MKVLGLIFALVIWLIWVEPVIAVDPYTKKNGKQNQVKAEPRSAIRYNSKFVQTLLSRLEYERSRADTAVELADAEQKLNDHLKSLISLERERSALLTEAKDGFKNAGAAREQAWGLRMQIEDNYHAMRAQDERDLITASGITVGAIIIIGFLGLRFLKVFSSPPGGWVIGVAQLFLRKKRLAVVEEEIEDMRQEVYEALAEKRWLRARWLSLLYAIGLGWSALKWAVNELKGVPGKVE